jgi:hypothetical protein
MNQNKSFLFWSWFSQVLCYSNGKLINTVVEELWMLFTYSSPPGCFKDTTEPQEQLMGFLCLASFSVKFTYLCLSVSIWKLSWQWPLTSTNRIETHTHSQCSHYHSSITEPLGLFFRDTSPLICNLKGQISFFPPSQTVDMYEFFGVQP